MDTLMHLVVSHALLVVFVAVLLDQGGLPLPAYPVMMFASSVHHDAPATLASIVLAASAAALLADGAWYLGGRRFGSRLLRVLCRVSLSPDSCVIQTRGAYTRWGAASLTVAKFVPGLAAVATAMAGEARLRPRTFVLFDGAGALLWATVAVLTGVIFHDAIQSLLGALEDIGRFALPVIGSALIAFVAIKWWKRRSYLARLRMARISAIELSELLAGGGIVTVLDVRAETERAATGWIRGARFLDKLDDAARAALGEVVVCCNCPDEASAAVVALELERRGVKRVRPLAGGFSGWRALGLPVTQG